MATSVIIVHVNNRNHPDCLVVHTYIYMYIYIYKMYEGRGTFETSQAVLPAQTDATKRAE